MAVAAKYTWKRKNAPPGQAEREKGELANPEGMVRAIASLAARHAAKRASARVRKSAARRAQEAVLSEAKRVDIDTPESMRDVMLAARRAVRSVRQRHMGARYNTVVRIAGAG